MKKPPILNLADVELKERPPAFAPTGEAAERYQAKMGYIGPRVGSRKLGYNITALAPGKAAFPRHSHRVNEEMFLILEGAGEARIGEATYPIRAGDVIACPPGGPETAHQIRNTGDVELRYLAVSTRESPDLVDYPQTGRFGVFAELATETGKRTMMFIGDEKASLDYWEGQ